MFGRVKRPSASLVAFTGRPGGLLAVICALGTGTPVFTSRATPLMEPFAGGVSGAGV